MSNNPTFSDGTPIFPMRAVTHDDAQIKAQHTTRLTDSEQAMLRRLERWDRPGCAHTINLGQALTDIRTALGTIAGLREQLQARTRCNHDNFEAYKRSQAKLAACEAQLKEADEANAGGQALVDQLRIEKQALQAKLEACDLALDGANMIITSLGTDDALLQAKREIERLDGL